MSGKRNVARILIEELAPFILLALVIIFFCILLGPRFVGAYNIRMVTVQSVVVMLAAMGATAVIVSAGIDLSVGSTLALTTVVISVVTRSLMASGWSAGLASATSVVAGIALATACGSLNGLSITLLRVNPFVTTLGTRFMFRGLALWIAGSRTIETGRDDLRFLMDISPPEAAKWLLVSPGVWIALVALIVAMVLLKLTVFGRYIYAVGSSEGTARLCGVRVGIQKLSIYIFAGFMAGIAGTMLFSYQNQGDPTAADGKELYVIAAAVIGGASLSGGRGSAIGTAVGALFVQFLEQGLVQWGVADPIQKIIVGAFLILAVALDQYRARRWGQG